MKALQTWVPPRWLHPALAFVLVVAVLVTAGLIYAPSLIIVWPMAGVASIVVTYISGGWNDGDPLSGQAFLGVVQFLIPPFGIAMWIDDLQDYRRRNIRPAAVDVPAGEVADIVGLSVFGLIVFGAALTFFCLLLWG